MTAHGTGSARLGAVVLNYGTAHDALLAVRSLQRSRRRVDDLLVVDNASQDGSAAWLAERLADVQILVNPRNLGYSGGMNSGIRAALERGADLVLLLNADVILPPEASAALEAALAMDRSAGIGGPLILARSEAGRVGSAGMSFRPRTGRMRHLGFGAAGASLSTVTRRVAAVEGSAMLVRRQVFERVGLFDERFFFGFEDLDFCLRAASAGFTTLMVGSARAYHEGGASLAPASPDRLYYGTRNQLLVASRSDARLGRMLRFHFILALNLAHALTSSRAPRLAALTSVAAGARDYLRGEFGRRK